MAVGPAEGNAKLRVSSGQEPGGAVGKAGHRESTVQSASDAAGIFDLYGQDPSRESYLSTASREDEEEVHGDRSEVLESPDKPGKAPAHTNGNGNGHHDEPPATSGVRDSGTSWSGPMDALQSNRDSTTSISSVHISKSSSLVPGNGGWTPEITITRDNTPSKRASSGGSSGASATSASPKHPAPSSLRLTPRHTMSGNTSVASSTSQVSVGSSKYPGEEEDAFHVRSTYARLEAVGVHGDGWDPGVERTRGGPTQGRKATVAEVSAPGQVGASEREYLSNLDRYGFVNEPLRSRETRLALIPVSPLSRVPKLPARSPLAGRPRPNLSMGGSDGSSPPAPPVPRGDPTEGPAQRKKENERVDKWMKMMKVSGRDQGGNITDWEWRSEVKEKVGRRVYKGVPDRWRMAAWWTLAEDMTRKEKGKGRQKTPEELGLDFRQSIDQPSTFDVQIDLDVPRTISGHTLFVTRYGAGQRSLFHVLHCFSMLCDTCGYVQGMGPIAATLLCYFDPERVYALLVRLHNVYGMHTIFAPGFPGLLEAFYVQERLMEWLMPEVFNSFARSGVSSTAYGTKWYITLFVNTVPFSQQLRLWDAIWLDGLDVLIMMAVAILWSYQDLLSAKNANFESILSLLSSFFVAEDEDKLMDWIRKMLGQPNVRKKMGDWREEWRGMVREGKEGGVLL